MGHLGSGMKKISKCGYFENGKLKLLFYTRIMFSKGMVSKSKYWISEKIRVCQCPFACTLRVFFKVSTQFFKIIRVSC